MFQSEEGILKTTRTSCLRVTLHYMRYMLVLRGTLLRDKEKSFQKVPLSAASQSQFLNNATVVKANGGAVVFCTLFFFSDEKSNKATPGISPKGYSLLTINPNTELRFICRQAGEEVSSIKQLLSNRQSIKKSKLSHTHTSIKSGFGAEDYQWRGGLRRQGILGEGHPEHTWSQHTHG